MILVPAWLVIRGMTHLRSRLIVLTVTAILSPNVGGHCWKSFMERNNHTELYQHFSLENIPLMVVLSEFYMLPIVTFSCTLNIPQDNVLFVMAVSYWYTYVCLYLTAGRTQTRRYTVCGHVLGEQQGSMCGALYWYSALTPGNVS